ncbi:MAG: hypothetical protein K2N85_09810, partial [Lachnospiraceae bacterium]|nr:hypothetical protein [Lachnospiraceae bacterium]
SDKAGEYKTEADKGMKEDIMEAREKEKAERDEAVKKRREEHEKFEEKIEEKRNEDKNADKNWGTNADTVEISEEGKELLKVNINSDNAVADETKNDVSKKPLWNDIDPMSQS